MWRTVRSLGECAPGCGHAAGSGHGGEQRSGLVATLEVFVLGDRVDHDPRARLDRRPTVGLHHHRADGNGRVEIPREVEVADDAGVGTALDRLELLADL